MRPRELVTLALSHQERRSFGHTGPTSGPSVMVRVG